MQKERSMDDVKVTTDIEAADQLGMLVRRIEIESPYPGDLQKQVRAVTERITYLGCELKLIELDGISKAAQIRSKVPVKDGYLEIVLRGGNRLSLERKPSALHISRGDFERLIRDLKEIML